MIGPVVQPLRRALGNSRARLERFPAHGRGYISVIIPVFDVEQYIDACLDSLLSQDHWRLEIIVVDDGSTDATCRRVRRWARRDPRVRLLVAPHGGPNAARNLAIPHARGEFLTFLDGDDVLLAGAYRDMGRLLARTGSDFVVAGYDRLIGEERTPAAFWIRDAHAVTRERVTLTSFPQIMVNSVQWSKLYRREFWLGADLSFPVTGHYQDQVVSAHAYSRARAFDILSRPTVAWRIREDGSSMTQRFREGQSIQDRFDTSHRALDVYRAHAGEAAARQRLVQYLSNDIAQMALHVESLDADGWVRMRAGLMTLADRISESSLWDEVPAEFKVVYDLIVRDDRARAEEYARRGGFDLLQHRLEYRDGCPYVALPFWEDAEAHVPIERFRAAPRELRAFADAA